jgi:hypothetical protein
MDRLTLVVLSIVGSIMFGYGLAEIISLTRINVNNQEEINQITSVFNISQIFGWIIVGIIIILVLASFAFPPLRLIMIPFQTIIFIGFLASLVLSIINTILYKQATDPNPDYGKNVNGQENILAAKKDSFIRGGIFMTIIGSVCLVAVASSLLKK